MLLRYKCDNDEAMAQWPSTVDGSLEIIGLNVEASISRSSWSVMYLHFGGVALSQFTRIRAQKER